MIVYLSLQGAWQVIIHDISVFAKALRPVPLLFVIYSPCARLTYLVVLDVHITLLRRSADPAIEWMGGVGG